ncbi:MAG: hypothetical protein P8J27_03140 [Mariniblastus sp.]|nr:hypothetical protein [Mariniblastus sp.]
MHFVAGPWFTVHKNGEDWQRLGHIWISNGDTDCQGHVEIKIEMIRGEDYEDS